MIMVKSELGLIEDCLKFASKVTPLKIFPLTLLSDTLSLSYTTSELTLIFPETFALVFNTGVN